MWTKINVSDFGWVGKLRVVQDAVAVDISGYTTLSYIFCAPSGRKRTRTAQFGTDGTDGVLTYTVANGDIDEVGDWQVQARIAKTGVELTAERLLFEVQPRL